MFATASMNDLNVKLIVSQQPFMNLKNLHSRARRAKPNIFPLSSLLILLCLSCSASLSKCSSFHNSPSDIYFLHRGSFLLFPFPVYPKPMVICGSRLGPVRHSTSKPRLFSSSLLFMVYHSTLSC